MSKFTAFAERLGKLVEEKNVAYGNSFETSAEALRLLYPEGVPPDRFSDVLLLARIWDKMQRIATDKDALGESPYQDIAGYGILGATRDTAKDARMRALGLQTDAEFEHLASRVEQFTRDVKQTLSAESVSAKEKADLVVQNDDFQYRPACTCIDGRIGSWASCPRHAPVLR